jgi:hypothetical protein
MRKRVIGPPVLITLLSLLWVYAIGAGEGLGCFYRQQPFGSACQLPEVQEATRKLQIEGFIEAMAVLITIWGAVELLILGARRWRHR